MLFSMFHAQIYFLTCLYVQIYMLQALCYVSYVLCLFLFYIDVRVTCSYACMMLLAMPCLDLCIYVFIPMLYGQILVFTCLYDWIHVLPCLCAKFPHVYMHVSMTICLDLCFHMPMCLDLFSLHALCYIPCACVLHAMFVCLDLGYVCHAMCYCSPFVTLSFFLSYVLAYQFGLDLDPMVFVIVHTPWPISKGLDHPYFHVYACLLLCFMLVLDSLVLGFATFDTFSGLQLYGYI